MATPSLVYTLKVTRSEAKKTRPAKGLRAQKGDCGFNIDITVVDENDAAVDISLATTKNMIFRVPGSAVNSSKAGAFITDGTDGGLRYVAESAFINTVGVWEVQAFIVLAVGVTEFQTEVGTFTVADNVGAT